LETKRKRNRMNSYKKKPIVFKDPIKAVLIKAQQASQSDLIVPIETDGGSQESLGHTLLEVNENEQVDLLGETGAFYVAKLQDKTGIIKKTHVKLLPNKIEIVNKSKTERAKNKEKKKEQGSRQKSNASISSTNSTDTTGTNISTFNFSNDPQNNNDNSQPVGSLSSLENDRYVPTSDHVEKIVVESSNGSVRTQLTMENTDEFGFDKTMAPEVSHSLAQKLDTETWRRREGKWIEMTKDLTIWNNWMKKNYSKVESRCFKGIPYSIRGRVWKYLCGMENFKADNENHHFEVYLKDTKTEIIEVIERDIDRCYPDHIMFRDANGVGQKDLFRLLKAYTFFNPNIGYAQGMGMVAGMFMMLMPTDDAFWMLAVLLEKKHYLLNFYDTALTESKYSVGTVFRALIKKALPKLNAHLEQYSVEPLMFATSWYMTVFTTLLPWASVLRVWDVFLLLGKPFLHQVALAILHVHQEKILLFDDQGDLIEFLLHINNEKLFPDDLFKAIEQVESKIKLKEIEKVHEELKETAQN